MKTQGDSASQVTSYVQEQIDKLSGLTGGNQQAQQAVRGCSSGKTTSKGSLDQADQAVR